MIQFEITIENFFDHNAKNKKGHTHFMVSKRIFNDEKIAKLTPGQFQLYLYCISICADMVRNQFVISADTVPKYFRIGDASLTKHLETLESFQLLKARKIDASYIKEENRKEKNRREGNISAQGATPVDPFFNKKFDPKVLPRLAVLWNAHCGSLVKVTSTSRNWNYRAEVLLGDYSEQEIAEVIAKVAGNSFLNGGNKRQWKATFAWFINPDNFTKVLAGDYENSKSSVDDMLLQMGKELAS